MAKAKIDEETLEKLINADYTKADIKKMSESELNDIIKQINDSEELLGGAIELNDTIVPPEAIERAIEEKKQAEIEARPKITDPEWTAYVLSLLTKDELVDGSPKCDGLRRVCTLLLGDFNILTDIIQAPNQMNNYHAVVMTRLVFANGLTIMGSADVSGYNTEADYARHSIASCETRSESRAIRKALKLVKVIAVEEKLIGEPAQSDTVDDKLVSISMISSLKMIANRQNIDLVKLINKQGLNVTKVEDLTKTQALAVGKQLSRYSTGDDVVPDDIKV